MPAAFSTIVVATDFSPNSERALHWAIALAKGGGKNSARIILVHALDPKLSAIDLLEGPLTDEVRRMMDRAQKTVADAGVNVSAEQHRGSAWQVINNSAKVREADLIVIGTRGRTGYKRLLLGSTADRLIRTASVPVLVIHPDDAPTVSDDAAKTVLVPVDFSEESSIATSMAARVLSASPKGGRIILLHAIELLVEWPTPDAPTVLPRFWDHAERDAKVRLDSIAASLRSTTLKVDVKIQRGYPPDVIEQECKGGVDLIAMGTQGKGGLDRMMIGSVAERVLQHISCPVLVVHRPGANDPIRVSA